MVNYTLLFKDEKSQISYFYSLDTNAVYTDKKPLNRQNITKWSFLGGLVAILLYPIIAYAQICYIDVPELVVLLISIVGIWLGGIISLLIIKRSEMYFTEENKLNIGKDQIKRMYVDGKIFRKKYCLVLVGLFLFSVISTIVLCSFAINTFTTIVLIVLWALVGMMYFTNRPVCNMKLKRIMK